MNTTLEGGFRAGGMAGLLTGGPSYILIFLMASGTGSENPNEKEQHISEDTSLIQFKKWIHN